MGYMKIHRKYLDKLKERRRDPFYQKMMMQTMRGAAGQFGEVYEDMRQRLAREGMPANVIAGSYQEQAQKWSQAVGSIGEKYAGLEAQRRRELEPQIEQAEYKYDIMKEQKRQKKKAEEKSGWQKGLQIGGTILGATIGTVIAPGAGTLMGAQIGGGVGQIGAGFVRDADPAMIQQGMIDTMAGISSMQTLSESKQLSDVMTKFYQVSDRIPQEELNRLEAMEFTLRNNPTAYIAELTRLIDKYAGWNTMWQ